MKIGDLIKHKKTNLTGIIINIFHNKRTDKALATAIMQGKSCTAELRILKNHWEVLNEAN